MSSKLRFPLVTMLAGTEAFLSNAVFHTNNTSDLEIMIKQINLRPVLWDMKACSLVDGCLRWWKVGAAESTKTLAHFYLHCRENFRPQSGIYLNFQMVVQSGHGASTIFWLLL